MFQVKEKSFRFSFSFHSLFGRFSSDSQKSEWFGDCKTRSIMIFLYNRPFFLCCTEIFVSRYFPNCF
jgi:hypothetical protein